MTLCEEIDTILHFLGYVKKWWNYSNWQLHSLKNKRIKSIWHIRFGIYGSFLLKTYDSLDFSARKSYTGASIRIWNHGWFDSFFVCVKNMFDSFPLWKCVKGKFMPKSLGVSSTHKFKRMGAEAPIAPILTRTLQTYSKGTFNITLDDSQSVLKIPSILQLSHILFEIWNSRLKLLSVHYFIRLSVHLSTFSISSR